eukprot:scaffold3238_cov240-Pinguiococcus_pyrenoidosus.AAC.6
MRALCPLQRPQASGAHVSLSMAHARRPRRVVDSASLKKGPRFADEHVRDGWDTILEDVLQEGEDVGNGLRVSPDQIFVEDADRGHSAPAASSGGPQTGHVQSEAFRRRLDTSFVPELFVRYPVHDALYELTRGLLVCLRVVRLEVLVISRMAGSLPRDLGRAGAEGAAHNSNDGVILSHSLEEPGRPSELPHLQEMVPDRREARPFTKGSFNFSGHGLVVSVVVGNGAREHSCPFLYHGACPGVSSAWASHESDVSSPRVSRSPLRPSEEALLCPACPRDTAVPVGCPESLRCHLTDSTVKTFDLRRCVRVTSESAFVHGQEAVHSATRDDVWPGVVHGSQPG